MYEMTTEVTVVRRKHKVTFRVGTTAGELMTLLKCVPPSATVDEVIDCIEEGGDASSIEFHEEKRTD